MVRIKGCNSDYIFDLGSHQIKEQPKDKPVYLKIFVCPNDMPSQVEAPHKNQANNWCQGTDEGCPDPKHNGHALIQLHQEEGIAFVTQNLIAAKGPFVVQPNGESVALSVNQNQVTTQVPTVIQPDGQRAVVQVTEQEFVAMVPQQGTGNPQTAGAPTESEPRFYLSVSQQGIVLQAPNGTLIQLNNSSIEITPAEQAKVKINGNLEIYGDLKINGNLDVTKEIMMAGQPLPTSS